MVVSDMQKNWSTNRCFMWEENGAAYRNWRAFVRIVDMGLFDGTDCRVGVRDYRVNRYPAARKPNH